MSAIKYRFVLQKSGIVETEEDSRHHGWNVLIDAEAVLVLVDLVGPRFPVEKAASLDFTATSGKTRLAHKWVSLWQNYVSDTGHINVPFLVYGVGCEPIKITVAFQTGEKRIVATSVIPLGCGE